MWKFIFFLSAFLRIPLAHAPDKDGLSRVEGIYRVRSIEKESGHTLVKFEKYPDPKGGKLVVLEVASLSNGMLRREDVLEISAEVRDQGKGILEAEQVLLSLPRDNGKMRLWLLSRKGNGVLNLQNISYLKMHGTEN